MSRARRDMDWKQQLDLAIDRERATEIKALRNDDDLHSCTMCGKFCASNMLKGTFTADMAGSDKA